MGGGTEIFFDGIEGERESGERKIKYGRWREEEDDEEEDDKWGEEERESGQLSTKE